MKRIGAPLLLVVAVLGAGAGFLLDQLLTSGGAKTFTPALPLPFLLLALAAIVVALALPIRRATRARVARPIDPFVALRVAVLARASSIVGAIVGGFAVGLVVFLLSRPAPPSVDSVGMVVLTIGSAAVLVVAGLLAEQMCTIRRDDDDEQSGGDGPGAVADGS